MIFWWKLLGLFVVLPGASAMQQWSKQNLFYPFLRVKYCYLFRFTQFFNMPFCLFFILLNDRNKVDIYHRAYFPAQSLCIFLIIRFVVSGLDSVWCCDVISAIYEQNEWLCYDLPPFSKLRRLIHRIFRRITDELETVRSLPE